MKTQTLYSNEWFDIVEKENDNGQKAVGTQYNQEEVIVLPYTLTELGGVESFGIIENYNMFRHDNTHYTCIFGFVNDSEDALYTAKNVLRNKSGYEQVDNNKWHYVGSLLGSKDSDKEYVCFIVDITNCKQENTKRENFKLVNLSNLILREDSFILSMVMKFFVKNFGGIFRNMS